MFTSGEVDRVRLVYNHFTSPIEQTFMDDVILPVPAEEVTDGGASARRYRTSTSPTRPRASRGPAAAYIEIAVYRALLESSASEQGAA